jgi:hypothetical protein
LTPGYRHHGAAKSVIHPKRLFGLGSDIAVLRGGGGQCFALT